MAHLVIYVPISRISSVDVLSLQQKAHTKTHDTTGVDVFRFSIIFDVCLAGFNDLSTAKISSFLGHSRSFG